MPPGAPPGERWRIAAELGRIAPRFDRSIRVRSCGGQFAAFVTGAPALGRDASSSLDRPATGCECISTLLMQPHRATSTLEPDMPGTLSDLGRRERQIMDIVIRRGRASAAEVLADLPDPPSYSSVRSMLRLLEEKGHLVHEWDGPRHAYRPTGSPEQLRRSAVRHLLRTFFSNSMESAVAAMLGAGEKPPSDEELKRLTRLIAETRRKRGRS